MSTSKFVYIWPYATSISDIYDEKTGDETFSDIHSMSIRLEVDLNTYKLYKYEFSDKLETNLKVEHQAYLFHKAVTSWAEQMLSEEFKQSDADFSILESHQFVTAEKFVIQSFNGNYYLAGS
jgi:hypothetical protein